jgi:hypothetical protein
MQKAQGSLLLAVGLRSLVQTCASLLSVPSLARSLGILLWWSGVNQVGGRRKHIFSRIATLPPQVIAQTLLSTPTALLKDLRTSQPPIASPNYKL